MRLHAARGVDGLAPEVVGELALADDARNDWTRAEADAQRQAAWPTLEVPAELDHVERHLRGGRGVIPARRRQPRDGHVRVADRLDLLKAVHVTQRVESTEELIEER